MPTVDIPERLYRKLEAQSKQQGLSVSDQAARVLAEALDADEAKEQALLAEIRRERESMGIYITEADLQEAKRMGRP